MPKNTSISAEIDQNRFRHVRIRADLCSCIEIARASPSAGKHLPAFKTWAAHEAWQELIMSSAVSGLSGSGSALYQYIQQLAANSSSSATTATGSTGSTTATSADPTGGIQGAVPHHHHGHGGGDGFFKQIESAISSALQSAASSTSGTASSSSSSTNGGTSTTPTDINQLIQTAIESVLQQNQTGASSASGTGTASSTSTTAGTNVATTTAATTTNADGSTATGSTISTGAANSSQQAFFTLLQQNGVDPQQFQSDLQAAFQSVGNGTSFDPAQAFRSFPTGSFLDAVG
jgi:hypothetical protein